MAEQRPGPVPSPDERHEHSDANAVGMIKIGVGLLVLILVVLGLMFGMLKLMEKHPPAPTTQLSALADQNALPPEPRLQVDPPVDLMNYRQWEDSMLTTYAWIDRTRGTVRVPVDSAIMMVVRKGLPVDPLAAAALEKETRESGARAATESARQAPSGGPLEPETSAPPGTTGGKGTRELSPRGAHAREDRQTRSR